MFSHLYKESLAICKLAEQSSLISANNWPCLPVPAGIDRICENMCSPVNQHVNASTGKGVVPVLDYEFMASLQVGIPTVQYSLRVLIYPMD